LFILERTFLGFSHGNRSKEKKRKKKRKISKERETEPLAAEREAGYTRSDTILSF